MIQKIITKIGRINDFLPLEEVVSSILASRKSGGIIFTTIQKFSLEGAEDNHPVLCERTNVVVISDEAHRSQYGTKGRLDTKTGKYVYGYAKHMRDALPGASFIGFTGTPIKKADANTQETFGHYISIYDIEDAKEDKAVGLDRWARPLVRANGRCEWRANEQMKNSLRLKRVKWARRGGHALPGSVMERDAPATDWGETPAATFSGGDWNRNQAGGSAGR